VAYHLFGHVLGTVYGNLGWVITQTMRRDAASIADDVQRRSAHIHWPGDVNPDRADLFAHNDIVVNAPADVIWSHLVRASAWPS
jgi:hypothetical protein